MVQYHQRASRMTRIERLELPMLAIWEARDDFQPTATGRVSRQPCSRRRFVSIDDAGHLEPKDAPVRITREPRDFRLEGDHTTEPDPCPCTTRLAALEGSDAVQ